MECCQIGWIDDIEGGLKFILFPGIGRIDRNEIGTSHRDWGGVYWQIE